MERLGRGTLAPHHHHAHPRATTRSSAPTTSGCGSPTARSPNTNAAASCTSTPCIRLDQVDPTDPDAVLAPPADITAAELAQLVTAAVTATRFLTPGYADTGHAWPIEWGPQLDVRPVTLTAHDGTPDVSTDAVAAYLAKYATKATEPTGLPITGRMNAETAEHYADPATHLGRLIAYAWQLGGRPSDWTSDDQRERWHDTYGRLRRWTHMLGFGGHFATKSRRYSTTHKALRAARREWRRTTRNDWWNRHHPAARRPTGRHRDHADRR